MATKPNYKWNRYWCLREGSMMVPHGYLYVFDDYSKDVVTFEKIAHLPCLALLGEPGIGKTFALETETKKLQLAFAADANNDILFFNLRSYSTDLHLIQDVFENQRIKEWLTGSYTLHLYLDSLDEGLLRIDALCALLVDRFKSLPIDRLRLRITCRTAEWSTFLEHNLKEMWGDDNFSAHELAPLQSKDVRTAAQTEGLNADAFLLEVARKAAEPLAAKPVTLRLLLNLYRNHGALPTTQAELYQRGCLLLCEEENEARKRKWKLTPNQRLRIAARLAAVTIFANKASFWMTNDTGEQTESDVMVRDLAGGFEKDTDGTNFHVTEDVVRETLYATGLFTSRGINRLGWQHQTYAEFLAAWYLDYLKLDDERILHVLKHSEDKDSLLVPQLYETAAWAASQRRDVFQRLMEIEPIVLLRSDVLSADDVIRAQLTSSLLKIFVDEKEMDTWGVRPYYSRLKHSALATQLRPYIKDKTQGFLVRRVAIDIAEECEMKELQNDLVSVALDQTEEVHTRVNAAHAISEIGNSQTRAKLKPLALGQAGEDPDLELKGYGLMSVWPEHMSAAELFATLGDPPNLYGGYKGFLDRKLISGLKREDLPIALNWVRKHIAQKGSFDFEHKELASEILLMAWDSLDNEEVLEAFVQVVLDKIRQYDELLEDRDSRDKLGEMRQDTPKRKRVLLKILPYLSENQDWLGLEHSIVLRLDDDDIRWLIEEVPSEGDDSLRNTILLIIRDKLSSWFGAAPEVLTEVYAAMKKNELLKSEFSPFFEAIPLESEAAQEARSRYERMLALRKPKRSREEKPLVPSPSERVLMMLDKFEQGNIEGWWQLNLEMTLESGSKFYGDELEVDLRKLPGWKNASRETHERMIAAAKKYLVEGSPKPSEWMGTNTLYRPAFSGYRALWLLWHLEPNFIENMSTDLWRKWAPIIFHYPIFNGSGEVVYGLHRKLIAKAYDRAPEEVVHLLMEELNRFGFPDVTLDLAKMEDSWDERLLAAVRSKLSQKDVKPKLFKRLLNELIQLKDAEVVALAKQALILPIPSDEEKEQSAVVAASSLLLHTTDAWESVWPAISSSSSFGMKVIESIAARFTKENTSNLSESQIADFYIYTSQLYPHSDDPQFPMGIAHFVGTREEVARLRDSLLSHLKEQGTPESLLAIERIAQNLPHLDWLKWTLIEAKKNVRRQTWKPLKAEEVIRLHDYCEMSLKVDSESSKSRSHTEASLLSLWGQPVNEIPNLSELIEAFTSLKDRLAFFIGGGLSVPIFPLWEEVLSKMVNRCDSKKLLSPIDRDELLSSLNQRKDYLDIAATCVEALGSYEYRSFLEDQFDKEIDVEIVPAYQELFKLRPRTIITTNFDQIPERLNGSSLSLDASSATSTGGHYRIFTNRNVAEGNNFWKSGKPSLFKMHGCITDQSSIVFTQADFRRVIHSEVVSNFLRAVFTSQTVLFLGFGFSDPHIDSILSFLFEVNSGLASPHYVLANDLSNIQKDNLERKYGVRVINYASSDGHPQLLEFIHLIRELA